MRRTTRTAKATQKPMPLELHQGVDYAVIMRRGETTDGAFVQVRYPDGAAMALLRQMTAAPDMLATLKATELFLANEPNLAHDGWMAGTLRDVRAAINKAAGKEG